MNNYTIKKMLPRLVIAAVLVNVSFWICALAVDLSNIVGYSLKSLLDGIMKNNMTSLSWDSIWSLLITGAGLGGLTAGIGAGAAAATATMGIGLVWLVLPLLILAVISVLTALFVLIVRQALVIILIVLSPLAFVAFLLPNTEKWFTKWRELFMTMLLFFPLFSLLFGGATLAMNILISAAESVGSQAGNNDPWRAGILFISGITIQFLVMFSAPFAVKFSGSTVGGIAGKFQGGLTKMSAPLNKISKDKLELSQKSNLIKYNEAGSGGLFGRGVRGFQRFRRRDKALGSKYDAEINRADQEWLAGEGADYNNKRLAAERATSSAKTEQEKIFREALSTDTDLLIDAAGIGEGSAEKLKAMLADEQAKEIATAISNEMNRMKLDASVSITDMTQMAELLEDAMKSGDSVKARAVQNVMLTAGGAGIAAYRDTINGIESKAGGLSSKESSAMQAMKRNIVENHGGVKSTASDIMMHAVNNAGETLEQVGAKPGTWKMGAEDMVHQKTSSILVAIAAKQISKADADEMLNTPELAKYLDKEAKAALRAIT